MLEGPRWCIGWWDEADGCFCTPSLDLDILHSVPRAAVLKIVEGPVREGRWSLAELKRAKEVIAFSTGKDVCPVSSIDDTCFTTDGKRTAALRERYMAVVHRECGLVQL